ncbi:MAG: recombinase family protein [Gammaproteobacteria bacterium]
MRYGYARCSSAQQDTSIQIDALTKAGCEIIREEKVSGTSLQGRTELQTLLEFLRHGDELVVTRIDRLARSIFDLQVIVKTLEDKGVSLHCTEQPVDTSTAVGKCFLQMLGVFAEFETNLRKERQMEGIAKAKAEGRYNGRPPTIDKDKVIDLAIKKGLTNAQIAKELDISRGSVYNILYKWEEENGLLTDATRRRTKVVKKILSV